MFVAGNRLGELSECQAAGNLADTWSSLKPTCKKFLVEALARYSHSWSGPRAQLAELDYRLIGERHASALSTSEASLAQFHNLIGLSIDQLTTLDGGGIRPEEIAELLQAAGVAAVGIRVD